MTEDSRVVISECLSQASRLGRWFSLYHLMAGVTGPFQGGFHILGAALLPWICPLLTVLKEDSECITALGWSLLFLISWSCRVIPCFLLLLTAFSSFQYFWKLPVAVCARSWHHHTQPVSGLLPHLSSLPGPTGSFPDILCVFSHSQMCETLLKKKSEIYLLQNCPSPANISNICYF